MGSKLSRVLRSAVLALALLLGLTSAAAIAPVAAQEEEATAVVDEAQGAVQAVDDEEDDGFDDWGLLGLLGLAGLAGLLRRPARAVVVDDQPRAGGTRRT